MTPFPANQVGYADTDLVRLVTGKICLVDGTLVPTFNTLVPTFNWRHRTD